LEIRDTKNREKEKRQPPNSFEARETVFAQEKTTQSKEIRLEDKISFKETTRALFAAPRNGKGREW
jgi:hypothetical protein